MEQLCIFYSQLRILGVECADILCRQFCVCMCVNDYISTGLLLGQKVQRFHINIPINQDDFLCRLPDQAGKKGERIIDLPVEK